MNNQALADYTAWLKLYKWDAFLTVRIPPATSPRDAPDLIKQQVIRPLCRHLSARIGALLVISYGHGQHKPHVHALLGCPGGQLTTRLQDAADFLAATRSKINTHAAAIDLRPYNPDRHAAYVAQHVLTLTDVTYYDRRLLQKIRTTK